MPKVKTKRTVKKKEEHIATGRNAACKWCVLHKTSKADDKELVCLWGVGNENADIVLVGEAPGREEILQESPFIGDSGKLLTKNLQKAGMDRKDIWITNIVKCRPPENRTPMPLEIRACHPYLDFELKKIKPKVIGLLGAPALKAVLGIDGITKLRGKPMWSSKYNCWCVPVFHPSFIIRNGDSLDLTEQFLRDLKYIKKIGDTGNTGQIGTKITVVDTPEAWELFKESIKVTNITVVDTETVGNFLSGKILTVQFSWKVGEAWIIPILHTPDLTPCWTESKEKKIWDWMKTYLEDTSKKKVGQNISYDYKFFKLYGITLKGVIFDTMLAHYLLDENDKGGHDLDSLSLKFTDMGKYSNELHQALGIEKEKDIEQDTYGKAPFDVLCKYGGKDVDCNFRVFCVLYKKIKEEGLLPLLNKLMIPLSFPLADMEIQGVDVDLEYFKELELKYSNKIIESEKELNSFPDVRYFEKQQGKPVNFDSPPQMRVLFFEILKLPVVKMTRNKKRKTNTEPKPSTDASVLEQLSDKHPIAKLLLEHRKLSKFLSTYIAPVPGLIMEDGKLHTSYKQIATTTGRLSSSKPNLQNIPIRELEKAKEIRNGFVVPKGYILLEADYGQLEFRLLASECKDPLMKKDIEEADPHKMMASIAFNISYADVTKEQRDFAKTVNYAVIYGKTKENLAKEMGLSVEIVEAVFNALFTRYKFLKTWMDKTKETAMAGYDIVNWIGRRRRLSKAIAAAKRIKHYGARLGQLNEAMRQAVNSPIQGGGHDILSVATLRIAPLLKKRNLKSTLMMTIHDSLIFKVREEELDEMVTLVKTEMERPIKGVNIPMTVDMKKGTRLGEMEEFCIQDIIKKENK